MDLDMDLETNYEKRKKGWKKIFMFLVLLMIFAFAIFLTHIHSLIKKETPYILENCKFIPEKEFIADKSISYRDVEKEIKKRLEGEYNIYNVTFVFDPCIGWKAEIWRNNTLEKTVMICENGKIVFYKKVCKNPDIISAVTELLKVFT